MSSTKLDKLQLPDGRVVNVARHATSVLDLATQLEPCGDAARWPDIAWSPATRWPDIAEATLLCGSRTYGAPRSRPGHLLTYDGLATRVGLTDEDLRRVVVSTGNQAEATAEASRTFGNVLEAALAEQARRRGRE